MSKSAARIERRVSFIFGKVACASKAQLQTRPCKWDALELVCAQSPSTLLGAARRTTPAHNLAAHGLSGPWTLANEASKHVQSMAASVAALWLVVAASAGIACFLRAELREADCSPNTCSVPHVCPPGCSCDGQSTVGRVPLAHSVLTSLLHALWECPA